ncbi:MAG: exopolysaccharide biosynthesis protein [Pseudomonadota bacterium]
MASDSSTEENPQVLTDVMDRLLEKADGSQISVDDVLDAFSDLSFGMLCTMIGLIAALPIVGAIPGVSIITGTLILLVAGQYLIGRDTPWIPQTLRDRSIDDEKLESGIETARPYAEWMDGWIKPRIEILTDGPVQRRLIALAMCLLALMMIPLALIPWGVQAPATAIVVLGVALIGRDGVFAAIGYALAALSVWVMFYGWQTISAAAGALFG